MVTPRAERHKRLAEREIRPINRDEAAKRDWAEIESLEKGGPIAIADYYIVNNGSLGHFHDQIDEIMGVIGI